jgi:hypothetical protein
MASDSPSSKAYSADPALYIYTSLTAGSSHIVTATSRLETILRANKIPFKAIDIATDEKARMLWGRRSGKDESGRLRKLPGLVQMGLVLGDLPEIEEWNEYGELKMHVTVYYDEHTQPPISQAPKMEPKSKAAPAPAKETGVAGVAASSQAPAPVAPPLPDNRKENQPPSTSGQSTQSSILGSAAATLAQVTLPIRSIAEEAAQKAKQVHLQALRDKVYGKGGSEASKDEEKPAEKKEEEVERTADAKDETAEAPGSTADGAADQQAAEDGGTVTTLPMAGKGVSGETPSQSNISLVGDDSSIAPTDPLTPTPSRAGLQSPTTGTWRGGQTGSVSTDEVFRTLQSPTSGTWHAPPDGEPSIRSLHGSIVASASTEEIEAIEKEQAIAEEPEEEELEDEEDREREEEREVAAEKASGAAVPEKPEASTTEGTAAAPKVVAGGADADG